MEGYRQGHRCLSQRIRGLAILAQSASRSVEAFEMGVGLRAHPDTEGLAGRLVWRIRLVGRAGSKVLKARTNLGFGQEDILGLDRILRLTFLIESKLTQ